MNGLEKILMAYYNKIMTQHAASHSNIMQYEVNRGIFYKWLGKYTHGIMQQDRTQQAASRSNTMLYEVNRGIFYKWLTKNTLRNRQLRAQMFEGNTTSNHKYTSVYNICIKPM
jgi:hypothetical protein